MKCRTVSAIAACVISGCVGCVPYPPVAQDVTLRILNVPTGEGVAGARIASAWAEPDVSLPGPSGGLPWPPHFVGGPNALADEGGIAVLWLAFDAGCIEAPPLICEISQPGYYSWLTGGAVDLVTGGELAVTIVGPAGQESLVMDLTAGQVATGQKYSVNVVSIGPVRMK